MKHLIFFFLVLSTSLVKAQVLINYTDAANLIQSNSLVPGETYHLVEPKVVLVAKTVNTFFEQPLYRTVYALDYDKELFNFATKVITGIDEIECIIRCNGAWFILNDAGHKPYKVLTIGGNVTIYFTKTYDKVISFTTSLDDTYSASPLIISCGPSVGFSNATLYIYKTLPQGTNFLKIPMTLAELSIPGSNIFIRGKLSKQIQL